MSSTTHVHAPQRLREKESSLASGPAGTGFSLHGMYGNDFMKSLLADPSGGTAPDHAPRENPFRSASVGDEVASALESCFGSGIGGIDLSAGSSATARSVGADAYTVDHTVDMGGHDLSGNDLHAVELLAHEVSHALADGGSGEELLSRRDDPGERTAEDAGKQFRSFAEGSFQGPAPKLRAAHGGRAKIHRSESAEHADAVDGALERLEEMNDPDYSAKADAARDLLDPTMPIRLGNTVEMTPGEITALMGDFYGIFDEDGNFDVDASFEQLWNGDKAEAEALLELLRQEKAGAEISHTAWEKALSNREHRPFTTTDPTTGERRAHPQLGMLELAKRNDSHFSGPDMEGTDNNMGTYTAFHERALAAAANGPADLNRVRALEACGMHYLTDRHAGGHAFDKSAVVDATGYARDGASANAFVKEVHDGLNAAGPVATNARGEHFRTFGDGEWDHPDNEANRLMTSVSVASSFAEVQQVLDGTATPESLKQAGYAAHATVPAFDTDLQAFAEGEAVGKDPLGVGSRLATRYGPSMAAECVAGLTDCVGPPLERHVVGPAQEKRDEVSRDWGAWEQWLIDGGAF